MAQQHRTKYKNYRLNYLFPVPVLAGAVEDVYEGELSIYITDAGAHLLTSSGFTPQSKLTQINSLEIHYMLHVSL